MSSPLLLAVDDEVGVRESLKMVFCKEYRLLEAASVDAAIHKVQEEKPHVVLLDILMPKTDGIEILRQIKAIHPGCEKSRKLSKISPIKRNHRTNFPERKRPAVLFDNAPPCHEAN